MINNFQPAIDKIQEEMEKLEKRYISISSMCYDIAQKEKSDRDIKDVMLICERTMYYLYKQLNKLKNDCINNGRD